MKGVIYGFGFMSGIQSFINAAFGDYNMAGTEFVLLWWSVIVVVIYWICQRKWRWM